jgi:hypothetical protein
MNYAEVLMSEEIKILYESTRNMLQQTEALEKSIKQITHKKLAQVLIELIKNLQADLLVLLDIIWQCENCETKYDVDELIECFSESNNELVS